MIRIIQVITVSLFLVTLGWSQTVTTFNDGSPDDAIALDSNGNIYASGFTTGSVYMFTPTGDGSTFISGLVNPNGIDFDSNDFLFLCDWGGNKILRYDTNGIEVGGITIPGNPSGMLKAHDNDDMIYTRYSVSSILRITAGGVITPITADPELNGPVGLAYNDDNELYVGNYNDRTIYKVLNDGSLEYVATVGGASNLGFIAYANGMLWGTVLGEHKIYKINPNAVDDVTLFAGSTGGNADGDISVATFNQPNGIRFSEDGNTMYVTDFGTKNLRVISGMLGLESNTLNKLNLKIYPNPTKDLITASGKVFQSSYALKIIDVTGKLLVELEESSADFEFSKTIDVSSLSSGTYFLELLSGVYSVTRKFVK